VSNKLTKEEFYTEDISWKRVEAHTAECVAEAVAEADWRKQLFDKVPWDKVRSTRVVVMAYDMAGLQVCQFGTIDRPKVTRPMTDKELVVALNGNAGAFIAFDTLSRPTLEAMAKDLGISTEVAE